MNENITVKVIDLTGTVGPLKASQLARLIEAYIAKHPELVKDENE
jgi:hypothetical protein